MGYEIKMIVGKLSFEEEEIERDLAKPFSDGSGYDYKYDANKQLIHILHGKETPMSLASGRNCRPFVV